MKDIFSIILKTFNENTNSHAFLLETNNNDFCLSDVKKLIYDINKNVIDTINENCPDVFIVDSDGKEIKKEQMSDVLNDCRTYPLILKHKYYIVMNSELMNQSASNVLLKFLEEPESHVIGFFITSNRKSMLSTILSRCQSYRCYYELSKKINIEKIEEFINGLEVSEKYKKVDFLNNYFSKDRVQNIELLKMIRKALLENIIFTDVEKLAKRLLLIDNIIGKLQRNANMDLIILNLVLEW